MTSEVMATLNTCQNDIMTYSLRLPPGLDADARAESARLGISLNGLVCVALDQYLRRQVVEPGQAGQATKLARDQVRELSVREGVPQLGVMRGVDVDRAFDHQMQRIEDAHPKKKGTTLTGPELLAKSQAGPPLSKAERVALTAFLRSQRR